MSGTKRKSKAPNSNSDLVNDAEKHAVASPVKRPWTADEVRSLLDQLSKFTNGEERDRGYKSTKTRIDWTTIGITGRGQEECREALNSVLKQVRCERTMHEVLQDAHSLLEHGTLRLTEKREKSTCLCPAKKPSLFLIYRDSVLQKVHQEHPGTSGTELMRIIGKMYKELNEKRKKRVVEEFKEREAAYKAAIEQARSENPAFECPKHFPGAATLRQRNAAAVSGHRTAPKARRPVDIYVAKKLDSKEVDEARREDLTAKYTRKYEGLPDLKKIKWIRRAQVELETTYREAAIAYWQTKPKFKPLTDYKRLLTPDERRIIGDQKEKHRPSLYTFFTTRKLRQLTDVKGNERLSVAAQMWKELSAAEKKALEVEWHRECGDAAGPSKPTSKAASAAAKRKAAKEDEDSDSEVETPKRTRIEPPISSSSSKRTDTASQKQPAVTTPKSSVNAATSKATNAALNNNPAAKAKTRAAAERDVKPAVESSGSETGSDADDDDDDEDDDERPPRQAPGKSNALTNVKKGAKSAPKPPAKAAITASKAPLNRPGAARNGNSSSDDDDDDLSD